MLRFANNSKIPYCFQCLRCFRMEYQIAIINTLIMLFAITFVWLTYYLQSQIILSIVQNSSRQILMRQERNAISTATAQLKQYINHKQNAYVLRLGHLDEMFRYVKKNQNRYLISKALLYPCVRKQNMNMQIFEFNAPIFCYMACGIKDRETLPVEVESIGLFNLSTQAINQFTIAFEAATEDYAMSISDFTYINYFGEIPRMQSQQGFDPTKRPWYTNHMSQMKIHPESQYFFSPVYKNFNLQLFQNSITYTIKGLNNENLGMFQQLIQITDHNITNIPYNVILVNQGREIIIAKQELLQFLNDTLYIDDVNKTGFNSTDWQTIQDISKKLYTPTCEGQSNTFCLFNQYYNKSVIINSTFFELSNFTLLIYSNLTFLSELDNQFIHLTNGFKNNVFNLQLAQIFSNIGLIFIAVLTIHQIFKPLKNLMLVLQYTVKSAGNNINEQIFKMLNKINRSETDQNPFSALRECFFRFEEHLLRRLNKKSEICLLIEQFEYSQKKKKVRTKKILLELDNLKDYLHSSFEIQQIGSVIKKAICQDELKTIVI